MRLRRVKVRINIGGQKRGYRAPNNRIKRGVRYGF